LLARFRVVLHVPVDPALSISVTLLSHAALLSLRCNSPGIRSFVTGPWWCLSVPVQRIACGLPGCAGSGPDISTYLGSRAGEQPSSLILSPYLRWSASRHSSVSRAAVSLGSGRVGPVAPIRVGPSCNISWFVEKRQDWKKAVLVGRCEIRVGPSCDLSLPVEGFGLEDGPSIVELTLS
jgi:hypothetical protein